MAASVMFHLAGVDKKAFVEGVKAGQTLTGLILDENRTITLPCARVSN